VTAWRYSVERHRYLYPSGRAVPVSRVTRLRNDFIAGRQPDAEELARHLAAGEVSVAQWERDVRALVKRTYVAEYALGAGGRDMVTRRGWGSVGGLLGHQYRFLRSFAEEVAAGLLSEAQIANRTTLYLASAVQAYERARVAGYDGLTLPAYPADGSMSCRCRCAWRIDELADRWECTWLVLPGDSCDVCLGYGNEWAPYVQEKKAA
jgi:hypothetical protein